MPTTTTRRRRKSKLLKYLPKAASAVSFQNPVFSPGREKQRLNSHSGFSGPMVSIIPDEARRRPRRGGHDEEETQEPSSPKVSCIGQIKLHKNKNKKIIASKKKESSSSTQSASHSHNHNHDYKPVRRDDDDHDHQRKREEPKAKKQGSKTRKIFGIGFGSRKVKNNDSNNKSSGGGAGEGGGSAHSEPAPSLGHLKRFSSGRQSLANFDWTAQIAPVNDLEDRNFHSDEEFGRYSDSEEEEEEVKIPFSAPILMGGGYCEPRKEVNLWQRRNTANPPPLKLN